MIYDKIENIERYLFLNKIKEFDITKAQDGKFEIDGDLFFGIGLKYTTKNEIDCLWESHKKYLDVHVILEGEEFVNVSDGSQMKVTKEYDETGDYMLHSGVKQQQIHLKKGSFLALFPNEVHQTAVYVDKVDSLSKVVFKVLL
jgi:biofilm protein TabA